MKKKYIPLLICMLFVSCSNMNNSSSSEMSSSSQELSSESGTVSISEESTSSLLEGKDYINSLSNEEKKNLSLQGYAKNGIGDFSIYKDTNQYRVVNTASEFINALNDARYEYETIWNEETSTYTQNLIKEGSVKVIEIASDLNLGYFKLSDEDKQITSVVSDYASKYSSLKEKLYFSNMFLENGISQIKIERTSNLLIYSLNGAKITHAGFKVNSCDNLVFRNIFFDELWQWEDSNSTSLSKIGDYDNFGWSYFKLGFIGSVWIDHCSFGKSYDGQIDYADANYHSSKATSFRAPYTTSKTKGLSITWCDFNAGSISEDGYIYKMMLDIEKDYAEGKENCLYYKALRDKGISFEDILNGLAIPQKKGFLFGDDQDYSEDNHAEYDYNLELNISISNSKITNFADRLPKIRGGNVYMYNTIFDSTFYYESRAKLQSQRAISAVTSVKSDWKCALVSQGIVCGQGGSVKAENCEFLMINTLLKNNDSGSPAPYLYGGYELINCRYKSNKVDYIGSSNDANNKFSNSSDSTLSTEYFKWHTEDGSAPFDVEVLI